MLDASLFSDVSGYVSIACWLGAQFPQVLENIRQQSSDGLALPFLLNWLLGDLTNLIGCILTHQLPFQTWLATYFCFVDFTLLAQYFYYARKSGKPLPALAPPYSRSASRTFAPVSGRTSLERAAPRYRTLSNVAANVAAAAAMAAQQEETHATSPYARTRWPRHSSVDLLADGTAHLPGRERTEDEDEVDEEALAALADSFHSEGGRAGRRKHVSWSKERRPSVGSSRRATVSPPLPPSLQITAQLEDLEPLAARGRSLQRGEYGEEDDEWRRAEDESQRRRSSRASRQAASMVFMGAWALFGVGTLVNNGRSVPQTGLRVGRVLSNVELPRVTSYPTASPVPTDVPLPVGSPVTLMFDQKLPDDHRPPKHVPPPPPPPSMERIIGRISAWTCTTLYLTSRLPQIWKNYVRKSVEGLSMYLFVFAFLGNFFYVISILSSPKAYQSSPEAASAYITESIP
ncbi:hypothetical protein EWM64_g2450 [Hericium alpestre]|uniref:Uncharacterized protein n=1 Tax=Hericium alpestre TaxID=135208 RepID=A0A4Z0A4C9_9AGAM|nr:hypothetical protein EWM64_g2450 [Hericium alpestre]